MSMKRKEEEERRRRAEREEKLQAARVKKVEDRAAKHWEEVRLIQSAPVRSTYVPFTPEESDACEPQRDIDACRVTIKEMIDSGRYTEDEFDIIRKTINKRLPQFNSEMSDSFNRKMKELTGRTEEEIEARRAEHPDACEIENFIFEDLRSEWMMCKEKFIKAYYFWQVVPLQDECLKLDALNNFLCLYSEELCRKIFTQAELAEPMKRIVKVLEKKKFPLPLLPRSYVPNRRLIDVEVDEALEMESTHRESKENVKTIEVKVLSAYFTKEDSEKPTEES